jgi:hypothetical protein
MCIIYFNTLTYMCQLQLPYRTALCAVMDPVKLHCLVHKGPRLYPVLWNFNPDHSLCTITAAAAAAPPPLLLLLLLLLLLVVAVMMVVMVAAAQQQQH